jgi:hypothetical protein
MTLPIQGSGLPLASHIPMDSSLYNLEMPIQYSKQGFLSVPPFADSVHQKIVTYRKNYGA